jgi:anthranilate synthase component 1
MNLEELKKQSNNYKIVPISKRLPFNIKSPIDTFKILKNLSSQCFILESLENNRKNGRYTFLGYKPVMELSCVNNFLTIKNEKEEEKIKTENPAQYIKKIIEENKSPRLQNLPPFTGGFVGYFSYDYIKYNEPTLKLDAKDEENFKDFELMLFDKIIVYDNLKQEIIFIVNIKTDNLEQNYNNGIKQIDEMIALIKNSQPFEIESLKILSEFRSLFDEKKYCDMVQKAKKYIFEGDIFQVVLSNRLDANATGSLFDVYKVLKILNPSPYMFYFSSDDVEIAGSSPETLVKLENEILSTFPLAGTRQRGKTEDEDLKLEKELLADTKELAEHNMLVDLGRNDIGKISQFGSVKVKEYLSILKFSHVMHIGSTIEGKICNDKNSLDAINAVLPAGTLSGAPKIRACEIINNLENNKRGIYGGAVGYIGFSGNMDTCISIRIAYKKNNKVFVRSGAGIVADSIPEKEYAECCNKMQAIITALKNVSKDKS